MAAIAPWPRTWGMPNKCMLLMCLGTAGAGELTLLSLGCSLLRRQRTVGWSRLASAGVPGAPGLWFTCVSSSSRLAWACSYENDRDTRAGITGTLPHFLYQNSDTAEHSQEAGQVTPLVVRRRGIAQLWKRVRIWGTGGVKDIAAVDGDWGGKAGLSAPTERMSEERREEISQFIAEKPRDRLCEQL